MDEFETRLRTPLLRRILELLPEDTPIYLVGGTIRDAFLGRPCYDLDFSTPGEAIKIGRKLADDLGGAYFPLDTERNVARIILRQKNQAEIGDEPPIKVDISKFQRSDLNADLLGRDFTINAMAVDVRQLDNLIDPTHGLQDLMAKRLRACSPSSLLDDPVRILRAVRFGADLGLKIQPETLGRIRNAIPRLSEVSKERVRDELFRMLVLAHPSKAFRTLDRIGALEQVLPEVCVLKEVKQSPPHVMDAWDHTLDVLNRMERLLDVLAPSFDPEKSANLSLGLAVLLLGRFRAKLAEHLQSGLNPDRPHRGLIFLAGLLHDVGKQATQTIDEKGMIRFIGHDQIGGQLAEKRGQALKLSKLEIGRLVTIVKHHMRPSLLSHTDEPPTKKAIYHFFRDTGAAGVDICILSMADILATYGPTLSQERWSRHLEVVRTLLGAWWEDKDERVLPPTLIDGNELQEKLGLPPGPMIGYLLESIREAQVNGEVSNRAEAMRLAGNMLERDLKNKRAG